MKVLVGILHSGEQEFAASLRGLLAQRDVDIDHFIISGLPNKQAHDELYARFMRQSSECDYFLKLDADMTFRSSDSLRALLDKVASENAAHALSYVYDVPSGLAIPGIQLFRSDSKWGDSGETLNVDYPPTLSGESLLIVDPIFVDHMQSPDSYQLFRYGIHKALKAIQHERGAKKSINKGLLHAAIINGIARNHLEGRADLIWALIGARLIFDGALPKSGYHSEEVRSIFTKISSNDSLFRNLSSEAASFFGNEIQNWFRWIQRFQSS